MKKSKWIGLFGVLGLVLILGIVPVWGVTETATNREFEILAQQYSYSPNIIRVNQGDLVKITLYSSDVMHGLAIDSYPVDLKSWVGKADTIEFVAERAGKFRMRCTVVCGPMHPFLAGELIVIPYTRLPISLALTLMVAIGTVGIVGWRGVAPNGQPRAWRLALPGIGWVQSLARQRWLNYAFILLSLSTFVLILLAAFFGSPIGTANFATVYAWVVWWAALIFILIPLGGRLWCAICPLPVPGRWMNHFSTIRRGQEKSASLARKLWPTRFRNIWLQNITLLGVALFSAIILTRPVATGIVLGGFFVVAIFTSLAYGRRIFCRYICPASGFIGMSAMTSPIEFQVKDPTACTANGTECMLGCEAGRDCPWAKNPGNQQACNAYSGVSSDCFQKTSGDNVTLNIRPFGVDLFAANGRRLDEIFYVFIVLTCAIIYITVYLGPWGWLKDMANIATIPSFLIYAVGLLVTSLIVLPGIFYLMVWLGKGLAEGKLPPLRESFAFSGLFAQRLVILLRRQVQPQPAKTVNVELTGSELPTTQRLFADLSYALIPLSVASWTGFTISYVLVNISDAVRLISDPLGWGWDLFGTAQYPWTLYAPLLIPYLQTLVMLFGLVASISTAYAIATHHTTDRKQLLLSLTPAFVLMASLTAVVLRLFV